MLSESLRRAEGSADERVRDARGGTKGCGWNREAKCSGAEVSIDSDSAS